MFRDFPMSNLCNFDQRIQICSYFFPELNFSILEFERKNWKFWQFQFDNFFKIFWVGAKNSWNWNGWKQRYTDSKSSYLATTSFDLTSFFTHSFYIFFFIVISGSWLSEESNIYEETWFDSKVSRYFMKIRI